MASRFFSGVRAGVLAALVMHAQTGYAHHTFAVDSSRPVALRGPITKIAWLNPHIWIHIEVEEPDGRVTQWAIEAGSPNALFRRGWNQDTLRPGMAVIVRGFRARNGTNTANCHEILRPDGTPLLGSGSGAGPQVASPSPDRSAKQRPQSRAGE